MASGRLWIRTEGSPSIGLGHVMRSLAIALEARATGRAVTYLLPAGSTAASIVRRQDFPVVELPDDASEHLSRALASGDAVLFDGYQFAQADFDLAAAAGARVGAMEDFGTGTFDVDVLVNPNPLKEAQYTTSPRTIVLLGPRYAPVRPEFRSRRRQRDGHHDTLLLATGGADVAGLAAKASDLLRDALPFGRMILLCGPFADLPPSVADGDWIEVVRDPGDVAAVFDRADAAITAAGVTTWELLCMGVPVGVVKVADNQEHVVAATVGAGAALDLGEPDTLATTLVPGTTQLADPATQERLSRAALALVDGQGAARIVAAVFGELTE